MKLVLFFFVLYAVSDCCQVTQIAENETTVCLNATTLSVHCDSGTIYIWKDDIFQGVYEQDWYSGYLDVVLHNYTFLVNQSGSELPEISYCCNNFQTGNTVMVSLLACGITFITIFVIISIIYVAKLVYIRNKRGTMEMTIF